MKLTKYFLFALILGASLFGLSPKIVLAADTSALDGLKQTASQVGAYKDDVETDAKTVILDRVGGVVGLVLSFIGIIFLLLAVYAGFLWMTAQGNEQNVSKAKDLLINAVIGLIIISAAYSITIFVGKELVK